MTVTLTRIAPLDLSKLDLCESKQKECCCLGMNPNSILDDNQPRKKLIIIFKKVTASFLPLIRWEDLQSHA